MKFLDVNLKKARALKGWTQQATADQLGIKLNAYQAYEEGRATPGAYGLVDLVRIFGITDLVGFLTDRDFDISTMDQRKEITKGGLELQRNYSIAPIRDKLAVNILLGLVDLE